jgi:hypothetical protein
MALPRVSFGLPLVLLVLLGLAPLAVVPRATQEGRWVTAGEHRIGTTAVVRLPGFSGERR